jgi:hypothetical protein
MSNSNIPTEFMNMLLFENQKAFWDERGKGARFRLTTIGKEFFIEKVLPKIEDTSLEGVISGVNRVLTSEGIIEEGDLILEDRLIRLKMKTCIHREVGERFAKLGLSPCYCLPANICVLAINEKLNLQSEIAEVKFQEDHCEALIIVFDE